MFNFPIFLNLETMRCLVVGAGPVGRRKTEKLLLAGAGAVCLLDPAAPGEAEALFLKYPAFRRVQAEFEPGHLDGAGLVFAATADVGLNAEIARLCSQRNILCNTASEPENGRFIVPASREKAGVYLAVRAHSPVLSDLLCAELSETLGERHAAAVAWLRQLRPLFIASGLNPEARREWLRQLAEFALNPTRAEAERLNGRICGEAAASLPPELLRAVAAGLAHLAGASNG